MERIPLAACAAALTLAAVGCGGGGGPVDTAVVSINIPDGNVAAPTFPLEISVSGCDVKKLELYDRGTFVQNVAFAGNPMRLELNPTQVKFFKFAESLSLTASLTCTDGRTAQSLAANGNFWPVKEVNTPVGALPKLFVAEGSGAGVAFIGCMAGANGTRTLAKVDKFGNLLATATPVVPGCSDLAVISDRHPGTGLRWLYDPPDRSTKWSGALAFNPKTMTVVATYNGTGATGAAGIFALGVGPDGDAVVYDRPALQGYMLRRLPHVGGINVAPVWSTALPNPPNAVPLVDASQSVVVPGWEFQTGNVGLMYSERYNYQNGVRSAQYPLIQTSFSALSVNPAPPAQLNASGSLVYFPGENPNGTSLVYACSTTVGDCSFATAPARKWQSQPVNGVIAVAWPYAKFSRIAAITSNVTTFISADTGQTVPSPTNGTITAGGQMVTLAFQPGAGREFYQLNGPNLAGAEPQEIVAMESAEAGELYRYAMTSGGLTAALDDSGEIWFRMGTKIVRPYPLDQYRRALLPR